MMQSAATQTMRESHGFIQFANSNHAAKSLQCNLHFEFHTWTGITMNKNYFLKARSHQIFI